MVKKSISREKKVGEDTISSWKSAFQVRLKESLPERFALAIGLQFADVPLQIRYFLTQFQEVKGCDGQRPIRAPFRNLQEP